MECVVTNDDAVYYIIISPSADEGTVKSFHPIFLHHLQK